MLKGILTIVVIIFILYILSVFFRIESCISTCVNTVTQLLGIS